MAYPTGDWKAIVQIERPIYFTFKSEYKGNVGDNSFWKYQYAVVDADGQAFLWEEPVLNTGRTEVGHVSSADTFIGNLLYEGSDFVPCDENGVPL